MRRLRTLLFALPLLAAPGMAAAASEDSELLEFEAFGAWEVWCVHRLERDINECFISQIGFYSPHPDFRAIVVYVHLDGPDGAPRILIDAENQSFHWFGDLRVDGKPVAALGCWLPGSCEIDADDAPRLLAAMSAGETLEVRFDDYLIEEIAVPLPLDGFAAALEALPAFRQRHGDP